MTSAAGHSPSRTSSPTTTRGSASCCWPTRTSGSAFVDAAGLAVIERYGERQVATLDHRHFAVVRLDQTDVLELLPAGE